MFRTVPLSIQQEVFTVHTAMVYVMQVCWQLANRFRMEFRPDPAPGFVIRIYHDAGQLNVKKQCVFRWITN